MGRKLEVRIPFTFGCLFLSFFFILFFLLKKNKNNCFGGSVFILFRFFCWVKMAGHQGRDGKYLYIKI